MAASDAFSEYRSRSQVAAADNLHHDQRRAYLVELLRKGFSIEVQEVELESNVRVAETRGRIDLLFRDLVFEVKRDLQREHEDVLRELTLYLSDRGNGAFGLATDGVRFEAYRMVDGELEQFDELALEEVSDDAGAAWIDSYLFTQKAVVPTAEDVVRRFGPRSAVFLTAEAELEAIWKDASASSSVLTKREEWDRLLRVVYGSEKGSDELFVRHTYLATVARLFAYLAIAQTVPKPNEVLEVITGPAFQRVGIRNLVEEDFFAWIADTEVEERTQVLLAGIASHLGLYATEKIDEDLLKQLYETLVDPIDRHDLGEFYTPDWLADLVLRDSDFGPGKTMLDPSCGSGTFIFVAIRLLREAGLTGGKLVDEAERNLHGLDVHPLAITVARANFVLALRSDLRDSGRDVTIPIWMADSLAVPEQTFGLPIEVPVKSTGNAEERFVLPTEMEDVVPGSLTQAVARLSELSVQEINDEDAEASLTSFLESSGLGSFTAVWADNLRLFRQLERDDRNTIWAFVLSNALRPRVIANEPVDLVVGNPPWLPLRDISETTYQERVTRLALDYGLLKQRRGWQTGALELATVFACFSVDHYLKTGGHLSFVLPRGVLFGAKQHEPFRKLAVRPPFVPQTSFDLAEVDPLFKVPSCVAAVAKSKPQPDSGWSVRRVSGSLPHRNASPAEAKKQLSIAKAEPLDAEAGAHSPYFERAVQGATLAPRPFWFVDVQSAAASPRPWLRTDEAAARRAKTPWTGYSQEGQIEADFLFVTVLAVFPFRLGPLKLVALPIDTSGSRVRLLSDEQVLRSGGSAFANWMRTSEEIWQERKKDSAAQDVHLYEYLDNHQNLTRQRPGGVRLIYGADGTHVRAAVVDASKVLDGLSPKPRGFILDMNMYGVTVASADEAHYLAAVLNTPFVNDAIKGVQTQGAWGGRHIHRRPFERVAIPEYAGSSSDHRELAKLSKDAHKKLADEQPARTLARQLAPVIDLVKEADELARRICQPLND
jgi:N-6 DNA Methylase